MNKCKIIRVLVTVLFSVQLYADHEVVVETSDNVFQLQVQEGLISPVTWDVNYSSVTKELVEAIVAHNKERALELIDTMSQQELSQKDTIRRTVLMIAIESQEEVIALKLVEHMDCESFFVEDMECVSTLSCALQHEMFSVVSAMFDKLRNERWVALTKRVEILEKYVQ